MHLWAIVDDAALNRGVYVSTEKRNPEDAIDVYCNSGIKNELRTIHGINYVGEVDVEDATEDES